MSIAQSRSFDLLGAFLPENIFYLTNFWGEAIAISDCDKIKLIVPKLEASRAEKDSVDCEIISSERGSQLIKTFTDNIRSQKICVDFVDNTSLAAIFKRVGSRIVVDADILYQARMIKEPAEISALSKGAKILDDLYGTAATEIKKGQTEGALQAKIVFEAMQMGANAVYTKSTLNPIIIAGGPNAAFPHSQVSERKFVDGDLIVVDLTFRFLYYVVDATRTFALGRVTPEQKEAYDVVRSSQQDGIDSITDGVACEQVDYNCRQLIKDHGYGENFIHSTGHGIGLEVHEPPWLRDGNQQILRQNMVVTVEPGIYKTGKFGIRIEDSIVVSSSKPQLMNTFTKDLLVL